VLSGIAGREREFAASAFAELQDKQPGASDLLGELGMVFGRALSAAKRDPWVADALPNVESAPASLRVAFLAGLAEGANLNLGGKVPPWVRSAVADAVDIVCRPGLPIERQLRCVALLKHTDWRDAALPLTNLATNVTSLTPGEVRAAAVRTLVTFENSEVAATLLAPKRLATLTPADREVTLSAMLARPAHIPRVLDSVESGVLPRNAIGAAQRTALSKSKDAGVRDRAAKLFGAPADGDRMKAYESAKAVLALAPNAAHGREVFKTLCSSCHRLQQEGHAVGPDLMDARKQPKESVLMHIVVPDYEVIAAFAASNIELKDGRILAGIITSDTPESITLRQPLGVEENIPRANIASLTASEHSLMPAGLEATMKPQDLADLLSFLKGEAQ
jgi:putative heme-binding domain-containing protein